MSTIAGSVVLGGVAARHECQLLNRNVSHGLGKLPTLLCPLHESGCRLSGVTHATHDGDALERSSFTPPPHTTVRAPLFYFPSFFQSKNQFGNGVEEGYSDKRQTKAANEKGLSSPRDITRLELKLEFEILLLQLICRGSCNIPSRGCVEF